MSKRLSNEGESTMLRVRLTPAQLRQLQAVEWITGQTRSTIIRTLLDKHLPTAPAPTAPGTNATTDRQLAI